MKPLKLKVKRGRKKVGESKRRILSNSVGVKELDSGLPTSTGKGFKAFEEKNRVRCNLIERRLRLTPGEVDKNSEKIRENLLRFKRFTEAQKVAIYSPIKNEVRTESIFEKAKGCGKEVYFPRVEGGLLEFHRVDYPAGLKPGKFGIPEPGRGSAKIRVKDLDVIIVPGVAFDCWGRRLGYGGGHYDRTLAGVNKKRLIGLAYDFQVLDRIPAGVEDKGVGLLITESGIIFAQGGLRQ